jgi:hypothetical protein
VVRSIFLVVGRGPVKQSDILPGKMSRQDFWKVLILLVICPNAIRALI